MQKFCPRCNDFKNIVLIEEEQSYIVENQHISILTKKNKCSICETIFPSLDLQDDNLEKLNKEYKIKTGKEIEGVIVFE